MSECLVHNAHTPQRPMSASSKGCSQQLTRPMSARRVRPVERLLSGGDDAVVWPRFSAKRTRSMSPGPERHKGSGWDEIVSGAATACSSETAKHSESGLPIVSHTECSERNLRTASAASEVVSSTKSSKLPQLEESFDPSNGPGSIDLTKHSVEALKSDSERDQAVYAQRTYRLLSHEDDCGQEEEAALPSTIRRRYFSSFQASSPRTFEVVLAGTEPDSSSKDYLLWYYCDFIGADTADKLYPGPPFSDKNTTSAEELIAWLKEFKPRTRIDAYPMLQVAVAALDKLVQNEVTLRDKQAEALIRINWNLEEQLKTRDRTISTLKSDLARLEQRKDELEKDMAEITSAFEKVRSELPEPEAQLDLVQVVPSDRTVVQSFKNICEDLRTERKKYGELEAIATAQEKDLAEAQQRADKLNTVLQTKEQALERLQAYAKKQELEKYSIQKMAHEEKKMNVFAKFLKMSLRTFLTVWKVLAVKNRARRQQIFRTFAVLSGRQMRAKLDTSWQGWWEEILLSRRMKKIAFMMRRHVFLDCVSTWASNVKVQKIGRILMKLGNQKNDHLARSAWRCWKDFFKYQSRVRKAMKVLMADRVQKTTTDYFWSWRNFAVVNVLGRSGFGAKAKEKQKQHQIRRSGSLRDLQSAAGSVRRTGSAGSSVGVRRGSFGADVPTPLAMVERVPSNSSIGSQGQMDAFTHSRGVGNDSPSSTSAASSRPSSALSTASSPLRMQPPTTMRSPLPRSPLRRTDSSLSLRSPIRRSESNTSLRSNVSIASSISEAEREAARQGASQEYFLSTLLRSGSSDRSDVFER